MKKNISILRKKFGIYDPFVHSFVLEAEKIKEEYQKEDQDFSKKRVILYFFVILFCTSIFCIIDILSGYTIPNKIIELHSILLVILSFIVAIISMIRCIKIYKAINKAKRNFKRKQENLKDSFIFAIKSMMLISESFFKGDEEVSYPDFNEFDLIKSNDKDAPLGVVDQSVIDKIANGLEVLEFDLLEPQRIFFKYENLRDKNDSESVANKNKAEKELNIYFTSIIKYMES